MTRIPILALALSSLLTETALGQQVRTRGYGEADLDAALRSAIAAQPLIITRDTLIASTDTIRNNVLVVKARFVIDGTVVGDVTGVEANIYLRPTARVSGRVLNVSGGLYPSELARAGSLHDRALAPYHVVRDGDVYIIEGTVKRPAMRWLGGSVLPEYNRVDGLRVEVGPRLLLPPFAGIEPSIAGSIGYATERKDVIWRAQVGGERGGSSLFAGWESDVTLTNDNWIRSQLTNSLSTIWNGKDYRNYYAADRGYVEFRRFFEQGERTSQFWIRGQSESARPLAAGSPFVIFKPDSVRSNPAVPARRYQSAIVGLRTSWSRLTSAVDARGSIELAANSGDNAGDAFNAYMVRVEYAIPAIADHTLEIEANVRGPLPGTDNLPLQRWTFVGGSGTLYTHDIAQFPGDRLFFVETDYTIPFAPRVRFPLLGRPSLRLMHNVGMAWSSTVRPAFEQNIGARLQFPIAFVRYIMDPRSGEGKFSAGVTTPAKAYPWQKRAPARRTDNTDRN